LTEDTAPSVSDDDIDSVMASPTNIATTEAIAIDKDEDLDIEINPEVPQFLRSHTISYTVISQID
jgi:hypothetical protein